MDPIEQLLQQSTRILDRLSQAPPPARQVDQSETVGALAGALAKAQGQFSNPERNKTAKVRGKSKDGSPIEYSYRYADLADILTVIRAPLAEVGLSYCQDVRFDGNNSEAVVVTTLRHESGEWVRTVLKYPCAAGRIQDLGSIFTYLRRYSLSALIGIAPEDDDDGELAVDAARHRREEQAEARQRQAQDRREKGNGKQDTIPTEEELERFYAKFKELASERFGSDKEARVWLLDQEPNPSKAYTKRLSNILGVLKKKPLLAAAEGAKTEDQAEDPKQREAAQRRFAMLASDKGLKEEESRWWAGRVHGFKDDPDKGRPSSKFTPLPQIRAAIADLSKMDEAGVDKIRQEHAEYLEDLRLANEAGAKVLAGGDGEK